MLARIVGVVVYLDYHMACTVRFDRASAHSRCTNGTHGVHHYMFIFCGSTRASSIMAEVQALTAIPTDPGKKRAFF